MGKLQTIAVIDKMGRRWIVPAVTGPEEAAVIARRSEIDVCYTEWLGDYNATAKYRANYSHEHASSSWAYRQRWEKLDKAAILAS